MSGREALEGRGPSRAASLPGLALFRGGRCGRPPGSAALSARGVRAGTGCAWRFAPIAGSRVTVCVREIGHDQDPSGEGLRAAQRDPFRVITLGFLGCLGENPVGRWVA